MLLVATILKMNNINNPDVIKNLESLYNLNEDDKLKK